MPFAVCFRNRADRLTRVAVRQKAGGNIFGDHAACTDDDIVADMHPADDDCITSNPDIAADMDFLRVLCHRGFAVCVQPHALCGNQR